MIPDTLFEPLAPLKSYSLSLPATTGYAPNWTLDNRASVCHWIGGSINMSFVIRQTGANRFASLPPFHSPRNVHQGTMHSWCAVPNRVFQEWTFGTKGSLYLTPPGDPSHPPSHPTCPSVHLQHHGATSIQRWLMFRYAYISCIYQWLGSWNHKNEMSLWKVTCWMVDNVVVTSCQEISPALLPTKPKPSGEKP